MIHNQDLFKKDILRRVKRAHFYRTCLRPVALEISALGALVGASAFFVSLKHVYLNASAIHSLNERLYFILSAFIHTELSEKALSFATALVLILVIKDISFGMTRVARRFASAF